MLFCALVSLCMQGREWPSAPQVVVPSDASDLCTSLTVTVRQSTLQGHAKDLKYQFSSGRLMACR